MSEVNRMLGKVDELAVNTDTRSIPLILEKQLRLLMAFNGFNGTVEKINEEKRKLEVMVKIFGRKTPLELSFMQVEKYNFVTSIISIIIAPLIVMLNFFKKWLKKLVR
jgi:transcriptional antiterminator NusG